MKDRNAILDLLREIIADLDAIELTSNNQLEVDIKKLKNIYVKIYLDCISVINVNTNIFLIDYEELMTFANDCIEFKDADLVRIGEDLLYAVIDLKNILVKENIL